MIHMGRELGDALYQPEWMEFYDEMARHCAPVHILAFWPLFRFKDAGHKDRVSFSEDSLRLLVGQRLYDAETGELIADHGGETEEMAGAMQEMQQLWAQFGFPAPGDVKDALCSRISPNGDFFLRAALGDRNFQIIDAFDGSTIRDCAGHKAKITALAISPDGQRLATGDEDGTLNLWTAEGEHLRSVAVLPNGPEKIEDIRFGGRSDRLAVRYEERVMLMDENSSRTVPYDNYLEIDINLMFSVMAMAVGRQGLGAFDLVGNQFHRLTDEMQASRGHGIYGPSHVCFLPNQRIIAFGDGKMLNFYDIYNRKLLCGMHMPDYVDDIAVSRDGKLIAVVSGGQAQVWRLMYLLKWSEFNPKNTELLDACAWVQCAAHPDEEPGKRLAPLMVELQERGLGNVPIDIALAALENAKKKQDAQ